MRPAALQHRIVCAQIRDRGESWPTAHVRDGWLIVEAGETVQIDIRQGSPSAGQILRESARVADGQWHERDEQWWDVARAAERALETAYALLAWAESGLVDGDYETKPRRRSGWARSGRTLLRQLRADLEES